MTTNTFTDTARVDEQRERVGFIRWKLREPEAEMYECAGCGASIDDMHFVFGSGMCIGCHNESNN